MKPKFWHINKSSVDGVWYSGATYDVIDPQGDTKASFVWLFRARIWGLVHAKEWLPVIKWMWRVTLWLLEDHEEKLVVIYPWMSQTKAFRILSLLGAYPHVSRIRWCANAVEGTKNEPLA